ncbi:MAG: UDP-N-acetylmuramoyl-L-alanyl-D-glutamate--2,6-diaminopimelate ligase [Parcubacteria group bacterium]|nr:UDP-N-acetylmuramoyl-L-alanyl-D-glutamate--2,6-diaminopimelate ligase [Parcubacteria group bacterium]
MNYIRSFYRFFIAILANLVFYHPRKMRFIGVTGTDGKTTTAFLIYEILTQASYKAALCNGLVFKIGDDESKNPTDNTTPNAWVLQKFIHKAKKAGCDYMVIEATSWGIVQHRVWGVPFDCAVITNVTHEHLDVHESFEKYLAAKGQLFQMIENSARSVSVINADDPSYGYFARYPAQERYGYGIKTIDAADAAARKLQAENIVLSMQGAEFTLEFDGRRRQINLPLPGRYNISNALAAIGAALGEKVPFDTIIEALKKFKGAPGRFEEINAGQDFKIIVDFGHTPNAFLQVFSTVKEIYPKSRLIAVYGSAGGRDWAKRPLLGEVAGKWVDFSVLTEDDPRHEDPKIIAEQIMAGLFKAGKKEGPDFIFIRSRKEAIVYALKVARPNDVVILLGMGPSTSMYVEDYKKPWNDKEVVEQYLKSDF